MLLALYINVRNHLYVMNASVMLAWWILALFVLIFFGTDIWHRYLKFVFGMFGVNIVDINLCNLLLLVEWQVKVKVKVCHLSRWATNPGDATIPGGTIWTIFGNLVWVELCFAVFEAAAWANYCVPSCLPAPPVLVPPARPNYCQSDPPVQPGRPGGMEGGQLDLEESRRILEEDDDDGEEEESDAEEEEEREAESIQKLSSFTFHPEKKERGEGGVSSMGLTKSPTRTLTRGARLTSHMDDDDEDFEDDGKDDSIIRDNEESDEEFGVSKRVRAGRPFSTSRYPNNDDDEDDEEEEDNDDDNDVEAPPLEGVYDPREFDHLTVDPEVTVQNSFFNLCERCAICLGTSPSTAPRQ